MAITTAMTTSFKKELMEAKHNFLASGGSAFKFALIKSGETGTYNANTTGFGAMTGTGTPSTSLLGTDEVASGGGYTLGGFALTNINPVGNTTTGVAHTSFTTNPNWTTATFSANGGVIYNSSVAGNTSVSIHNFGSTQSVSSGTFTVVLPTNSDSAAILRIG